MRCAHLNVERGETRAFIINIETGARITVTGQLQCLDHDLACLRADRESQTAKAEKLFLSYAARYGVVR